MEQEVVDLASASRSIAELQVEISLLQELEELALKVRRSGTDKKWEELSKLLQDNVEMFNAAGHRRKLLIFTEHRDTLNYLTARISTLEASADDCEIRYIHKPFQQEPDFAATSVNYNLQELWQRGIEPI